MHRRPRCHVLALAAILGLAVACSTAPPPNGGGDGPPDPPAGSMQLVRDHAVQPSIDRAGNSVAVIAWDDASFVDLSGILVHDLAAGTAVRADVAGDGTPSDATFITGAPVLSADGTRVAFVSDATTLAAGADPNRTVFVKDLLAGDVEIVTLGDVASDAGCVARPDLSDDGSLVLFNHNAACYTSSFAASSQYLKDLGADTVERVSHAEFERSGFGAIAADGGVVAFESEDHAAVADDTNAAIDVFVRDLGDGTLVRASLAHDGAQADAAVYLARRGVSDDGRYVLMRSWATNLVPGDTNAYADIFLYDRVAATIQRVSLAPDGGELAGSTFEARLSGDGRYVVFSTLALNAAPGLTQPGVARLFVREVATGAMARLDVPEGGDPEVGIRDGEFDVSGDGRSVVFVSGHALLPGAEEGSLAVYRVENPLWTP